MELLNLGCGLRYSKEWTNVDIVAWGEGVIQHDLTKGIPYEDNRFDMVYHSHVLEHLSKDDGAAFMVECFRVLKPGGIVRVVVPDLEGIVKNYLNQIEGAWNGEPAAQANHQWMTLELLDQMVRQTSGGLMGQYWSQESIPNEDFIVERMGWEFTNVREALKERASRIANAQKPGLWDQVLYYLKPSTYSRKIRQMIWPDHDMNKFMNSGELHRWMYDRVSLRSLLGSIGFVDFTIQTHDQSFLSNWSSYFLDSEEGNPRKPDSIFIEAKKS